LKVVVELQLRAVVEFQLRAVVELQLKVEVDLLCLKIQNFHILELIWIH
jgi:hypothetical protein